MTAAKDRNKPKEHHMYRLTLVGFVSLVVLAQGTVSELRSPGFWTRKSVWPSEFTMANLEAHSRKVLSSYGAPSTILDFYFYPDREAALANCQCRTEMRYSIWLDMFQEYRMQPIAELVSIGESSVIRFRDAAGNVSKKVLQGRDPTLIKTDICSGELLYIQPHSPPRTEMRIEHADLTFRVRTAGVVSKACAESVAANFLKATGDKNIAVVVRPDAWFINEDGLPIIYDFQPRPSPPTEEQYESSPSAGCFYKISEGLRCWARNAP